MGRIDDFLHRIKPEDRQRFKQVYESMVPREAYTEDLKPKEVLEALFVHRLIDRYLNTPKRNEPYFPDHWVYYRKE